jgi:hypothetical protein
VEVELASGMVLEEDVYSGTIRFDGQELTVEVIITNSEDTLRGPRERAASRAGARTREESFVVDPWNRSPYLKWECIGSS